MGSFCAFGLEVGDAKSEYTNVCPKRFSFECYQKRQRWKVLWSLRGFVELRLCRFTFPGVADTQNDTSTSQLKTNGTDSRGCLPFDFGVPVCDIHAIGLYDSIVGICALFVGRECVYVVEYKENFSCCIFDYTQRWVSGGEMNEEVKKLGRREKRRLARREQMLESAMHIVAQEGLDGLTIAKIAKSLDAAVGALYRYFPSKDDLIVALQKRALEEFQVSLYEELARAGVYFEGLEGSEVESRALARVFLAGEVYFLDAVKEPSRHRLIDAIMSSPQPLLPDEDALDAAKIIGKILEPIEESLGELLQLDREDILCKQKSFILWATVHGLDHFRKRDRILPEALHAQTLFHVSMRTLGIGWGLHGELIEGALSMLHSYRQHVGRD